MLYDINKYVIYYIISLVKHQPFGLCDIKKTFIDMLFSYIIIDNNEFYHLKVRPTLNLNYCL